MTFRGVETTNQWMKAIHSFSEVDVFSYISQTAVIIQGASISNSKLAYTAGQLYYHGYCPIIGQSN